MTVALHLFISEKKIPKLLVGKKKRRRYIWKTSQNYNCGVDSQPYK